MATSLVTQRAEAQRSGLSLVRDAEIEALVREYSNPLMKAAGLRPGSVQISLVNDSSFNAFVSGRGMFIHTGLLLQAEDPNEVIGVIAHELGHVVGGHQIRMRERIETASRIAQWTSLLGLGLGAAAAVAGEGDAAAAGFGLAASSGGFALRDILKYQREEESAADRTAIKLLKSTKQSGKGMLETFKRLARNTSIVSGRIDPYLQSHPTPNQRLSSLRSEVQASPYFGKKSSAALKQRHDMVRAKIAAYTGNTRYSSAVLSDKNLHPDAKLYGRAILAYLYGSPKRALPLIDSLLKKYPTQPYINEMKGEILLRSARAKDAIAPFRRAVKYDKTGAGFLRVELGHALLESGSQKHLDEAIVQLRKGLTRDQTAVMGYQYLAQAYGRKGQTNRALLATAEYSMRIGRVAQAKQYAKRAQQGFKRGTPSWLRAEDIINYRR
ncbi:MAG: M48 family metalloprotease [Rhizobiaceae bacterium]